MMGLTDKILSAAAIAGLFFLAAPATAQKGETPGQSNAPPRETGSPDISKEIRGDIADQEKLSSIDKEIEKAWKIVIETRERAQNIRFLYAKIQDALRNVDCDVGAKMLETIRRSEDLRAKLVGNLQGQCKGIDAGSQRELAQACDDEAKALNAERLAAEHEQARIFASCPALRK
jgi:hypothetical protein